MVSLLTLFFISFFWLYRKREERKWSNESQENRRGEREVLGKWGGRGEERKERDVKERGRKTTKGYRRKTLEKKGSFETELEKTGKKRKHKKDI